MDIGSKKLKKILICGLVVLLLVPARSLAQEATDSGSPPPEIINSPGGDAPVFIADIAQATVQAEAPLPDSVSPQSTTSGQEANIANSLEATFDPHDAFVAEQSPENVGVAINLTETEISAAVVPLPEQGVSVEPIALSTANPQVTVPEANQESAEQHQPVNTLPPSPLIAEFAPDQNNIPVAEMETKELESEFSFKLENIIIPAKATPDWQERPEAQKKQTGPQKAITQIPNLQPSEQDGLNISGNCADKYFVVLLYANSLDYDINPASYIFNKAFDCAGGQYNYSLKDLPEAFKEGTYFLLIGGQGERGSWKPISALMPITINREVQ